MANSYQKLKNDISAGTPAPIYLFHGEESYLREYYLNELYQKLIPRGFEEFNYHRLEGKGLSMQTLSDAVEPMPQLAEHTLTVVTDLDIFKLGETQREQFIALLNDLPPGSVLVLVYDILEYKPNKTMKKLAQAMDQRVEVVNFAAQSSSDLQNWIARRMKALGKGIDRQTTEHLIFTCGGLMTGLVPEIEKIAAYSKGQTVTIADINAVADPVLDARIFDMTNAITASQYDRAATILGDLLKEQTEPTMILAMIGKEVRKIYTARIALDAGRDKYWLMELWGMKSDYPAKLLLGVAQKTTHTWCADAVKLCQKLDRRLKSETGIDDVGELKLLLAQLGAKNE